MPMPKDTWGNPVPVLTPTKSIAGAVVTSTPDTIPIPQGTLAVAITTTDTVWISFGGTASTSGVMLRKNIPYTYSPGVATSLSFVADPSVPTAGLDVTFLC